jgi:hypothetical protein
MSARRGRLTDERTVSTDHRVAGYLGPRATSFTLAWLATHRGRLHTLIFGGKRLSVLVVWDTKGAEGVQRSDAEVDAMATVVYGAPTNSEGT